MRRQMQSPSTRPGLGSHHHCLIEASTGHPESGLPVFLRYGSSVSAYNCQKKSLFLSEALTWKSVCLRTNPGSESWKKNLAFLKRHAYKQDFSAHFLAFSSRLALGLEIIPFFLFLKLARVETFEGGTRTLLEFQQMNSNGVVLKRDCTVLFKR